jgi:hypothetical protein
VGAGDERAGRAGGVAVRLSRTVEEVVGSGGAGEARTA